MGARGPLPDPNAIRRNAPTIPTTSLPASGRKGPVPDPPFGADFGQEGAAWWAWAWSTPQACGWSAGDLYLLARRASLEDALAHQQETTGLDLTAESDEVRRAISILASLCGGRLALLREARELDDRLGLSPKGLAALRWKIVDDGDTAAGGSTQGRRASRYGNLRAV